MSGEALKAALCLCGVQFKQATSPAPLLHDRLFHSKLIFIGN